METEFILYVADQEKSKAFYETVLGMKPTLHVPGMTEFILSPGVKLGLMPESGIVKILGENMPNPSTANGVPRCELYLKYGNVKSYYERALAAGAKSVSPPTPRDWGDEVAYVVDSDGNVLAFASAL